MDFGKEYYEKSPNNIVRCVTKRTTNICPNLLSQIGAHSLRFNYFHVDMSTVCCLEDTPSSRGNNPPRPGQGVAARDVTSESEEDEEEGVEWGTRKYGVRMSPAHPRYVGRGDDTCGGEVVYTLLEIRTLLRSQPEDTKRWLTTSQMGWALTREENEVINSEVDP
jgi:hypothetical protein